jgi:NAD+ synthase (glutamine-hydrolysing)
MAEEFPMTLRVALAQCNPTVGDLSGNLDLLRRNLVGARSHNAHLVVFPEMALCGYPPEDLLLKKHFLLECRRLLDAFAADCKDMTALVGFPEFDGDGCYNSLAVCRHGRIDAVYRKCLLPNYGVFDERRYFHAGSTAMAIVEKNLSLVLTICEDIWDIEALSASLATLPKKDVIINIAASPFHAGKLQQRQDIISAAARRFGSAVVYCNLIGCQDELVFDGRSMVFDAAGSPALQGRPFREDLVVFDIEPGDKGLAIRPVLGSTMKLPSDPVAEVYEALILGIRDYVHKNGFQKVLIGMSGGIDSALTAALAVDALGPRNVVTLTMPTRYNSPDTINDAKLTAQNLGIDIHTVPIGDLLSNFSRAMHQVPGWDDKGLAYENLQARIRGTILMTLSNQLGCMVLTTGNKSETAVGYSTLYGDTAGGFAVIKDVPKTLVYELSHYINRLHGRELIPRSVIDRIPSAELRDNQKDSDSLPEYDILDRILKGYVEQIKSGQQLIDEGFPPDVVNKVIRLIDRSEYKRRQCPPGIKITPRAFGKDRRMPITNKYSF